MSQLRESATRVPQLGEFRLGDWSICQAEGTLCRGDRLTRLEPRIMDLLVYLAAEPGKVVPKEELLEVVWGGAFVEEGVLSQAIHSLRKALGDDARQPHFVQTIPKRGYLLVAPVIQNTCPVQNALVGGTLPSAQMASEQRYRPIPFLQSRLTLASWSGCVVSAVVVAVMLSGGRIEAARHNSDKRSALLVPKILIRPFRVVDRFGDRAPVESLLMMRDTPWDEGLTHGIAERLSS